MSGADVGEVLVLPMGGTVPADTPEDTLVVFVEGVGAPPPPPDAVVQYVPAPTPQQVAEFLGWVAVMDAEQETQVMAAINAARAACYSYTRGVGFDTSGRSDARIANVMLALAARMANNPTAAQRLQAGNFTETPGPVGFLLHEMLTLREFRVTAA